MHSDARHALHLDPRRVTRALLAVIGVLVLAAVPAQFFRYALGHDYVRGLVPLLDSLFNLNTEQTPAAWFSSALLLLCGVLLGLIGVLRRAQRAAYVRHWLALGGIFVFLSIDETALLHERTVPAMARFELGGAFTYGWVVPFALFVIVVAVSYVGFLRALPARTRNLFVLAGALYVGGALGFEMVQGVVEDSIGSTTVPFLWMLMTHVEEVMEMLGLVVFVYALLSYLRSTVGSVTLVFGEQPAPPAASAALATSAPVAEAARRSDVTV